jgi:pilus assembly protein Flp/PilA
MSFNKSAVNCLICTLRNDENGATAIEYAFIAAGVALAIAVVVFTLGDDLVPIFTGLSDSFGRS